MLTANTTTQGLTWVRVQWRALKEESGASVRQRAIQSIGVTRDPAYISHTTKPLSRLVVEHMLGVREGQSSVLIRY